MKRDEAVKKIGKTSRKQIAKAIEIGESTLGKYLSGFAVAPRGVLQRAVNAARVIRKAEKAAKAETAADQVATGEAVAS